MISDCLFSYVARECLRPSVVQESKSIALYCNCVSFVATVNVNSDEAVALSAGREKERLVEFSTKVLVSKFSQFIKVVEFACMLLSWFKSAPVVLKRSL